MVHAARVIAWHRRFEARVIVSVALLVAVSLTAILLTTTRVVTARSAERAGADLEAARTAFHHLASERAEFASAQSALVTALPVFRAHLTDDRLAADVATLEAMAEHYRLQLKADFAIVTDRDGKRVAGSGWPAGAAWPDLDAAIAIATGGTAARRFVAAGDRLFLVVAEPAQFAAELLGVLTVGYAVDDRFAASLAEITHCEINVIANGRLYASTLPPADREALTAAMAGQPWPADGVLPGIAAIGPGEYTLGAFPLALGGSDAAPSGQLVLLEDWKPTQASVDEIRARLLLAGAVIFALALGVSVFFSRRIGRPLENLAAAAEDIANGNWSRQLPVRGTAEETMMAQAVNAITTSLRHWSEEARVRDDQLRQAQKLEALGRLAGGIAHDFNNFLTAIKGYGGLLLEGFEAGDRRRSKVEGILKAADTAAGLTRQLLAFSRRRVAAVQPVSLERTIAGTEKMLRRLIGEDVILATTFAADAGWVKADPHQIDQVLMNLVVNARDAMPRGGRIDIELGHIRVDETGLAGTKLAPGEYVRLSVRDTGCGMPPEVKARIFEPFFTTKAEGAGTGLGLAVVYGIVEQIGGAIVVDTEVGQGTAFHLYLPPTVEQEAAVVRELPKASGGHETVLLVEDEPQVAEVIAGALQTSGYTVLQAGHGAEALDIARSHAAPIHLLLTDVVMPGMNGRELADRVGDLRGDIRTLYMSGYADDAVLRHGVEASLVQFIPKPFSMDSLRAKIRDVLAA